MISVRCEVRSAKIILSNCYSIIHHNTNPDSNWRKSFQHIMKKLPAIFLLLLAMNSQCQTVYKTVGTIERYDSSINQILSRDAKAEIITEGFSWSEGPLWVGKQN